MHCDALRGEVGLGSGRELDGRGGRGQLGRRRSGLDGGRRGDGGFEGREALEVRRRGNLGFHRRRLRQRLQVGRRVLGNPRIVHGRRRVGLHSSLRDVVEVAVLESGRAARQSYEDAHHRGFFAVLIGIDGFCLLWSFE